MRRECSTLQLVFLLLTACFLLGCEEQPLGIDKTAIVINSASTADVVQMRKPPAPFTEKALVDIHQAFVTNYEDQFQGEIAMAQAQSPEAFGILAKYQSLAFDAAGYSFDETIYLYLTHEPQTVLMARFAGPAHIGTVIAGFSMGGQYRSEIMNSGAISERTSKIITAKLLSESDGVQSDMPDTDPIQVPVTSNVRSGRVANFSQGEPGTEDFEKLSFWVWEGKHLEVNYVHGKDWNEVKLEYLGIGQEDNQEFFKVRFPNGYILNIRPEATSLFVRDKNEKYSKKFNWYYEGPIDGRGTFCDACVESEASIEFVKKYFFNGNY